MAAGVTDDRRGTDAWRRGTNGWCGRTNAGGGCAAAGPWAERLPGPEMGSEWPGLGKGHGSPTGPRPRGRISRQSVRQSAPGLNGYPGLRWARNSPGPERATARRPGPGLARRGDKEAEASVPVKRGVKELYVQIPSQSIKDCRDFDRHEKVSCRTFVAKIFCFAVICASIFSISAFGNYADTLFLRGRSSGVLTVWSTLTER